MLAYCHKKILTLNNNSKTTYVYMKKQFLLVLTVASALSVAAGNKLDLRSRGQLHAYKAEAPSRLRAAGTESKMVTAIVNLKENSDLSSLEAKGMEVLRQRGDLAIVRLPMDSVETIVAQSELLRMQFSRPVRAKLETAHPVTGVDKVQAGTGLEKAYKGEGVIVSLCDQGLDPNHINFRKAGTTESRVKRLWSISNGKATAYTTASQISGYSTDDKSETHGTHVSGIMTGSYTDATVKSIGVAPEADIAMVALKTASDADICLGIENLIDYAKQEGKPLVVNISMGSNSGCHDGKSESEQYYASLGKEALICVAAGNEADLPIAAKKKFTASDNTTKGLFANTDSYTYGRGLYGFFEVYSEDETAFSLTPVFVSGTTGEILYEFDAIDGTKAGDKTYSSSSSLSKYFSGSFTVSYGIDEDSNRYGVVFDCEKFTYKRDNIYLGYVVEGKAGQTVYCYADAYYTQFVDDVDGWGDDLDADGSINNMATAQNIISVGAFSTRKSFKYLNGQTESYNAVVGDIAYYSSYGTLVDGRKLPHVCAPGHALSSSYSTPYMKVEAQYDGTSIANYKAAVAKVEDGGKYYFWKDMCGTSMACPYATGVIALWAEAYPQLTFDDVVNIITETSNSDSYVAKGNKVQWGAGKINAYEGLKKAIQLNPDGAVGNINSDKNILVNNMGNNSYEIFVANESSLKTDVYDLSGRKVATAVSDGNTVVVNLDGQQKGVYVIGVTGKSAHYSHKVLVK